VGGEVCWTFSWDVEAGYAMSSDMRNMVHRLRLAAIPDVSCEYKDSRRRE
jgi:hypothetical protein